MTLADEYKRQYAWRDWASIYEVLPPLIGTTVLDLGCAVGDHAADFVARGANVIGVDLNDELLIAARARGLSNTEFFAADLRSPFDLHDEQTVDGIWSSFVAAYFVDLPAILSAWARHLRSGGWIALTEIDDLFAHEPLTPRTRELFESYVQDALTAGRYDFRMGRKLSAYLKSVGFTVNIVRTVRDQEFVFDGPASIEVIAAWRNRLDRMKLLQAHCGGEYEVLRDEFLACLADQQHRSLAKVYACAGTKL